MWLIHLYAFLWSILASWLASTEQNLILFENFKHCLWCFLTIFKTILVQYTGMIVLLVVMLQKTENGSCIIRGKYLAHADEESIVSFLRSECDLAGADKGTTLLASGANTHKLAGRILQEFDIKYRLLNF